jgi:GTP-binding protein
MKIFSIQPAGTYATPAEKFPDDLPQVAFTGRSNVGKSSLINRLLGRKKLAPTSGTPGKTRKIQFIEINGSFYLVDLPGYGYAKLPVKVKELWRRTVDRYLEKSRNLRGVVFLLDIRREISDLDLQMLLHLARRKIPLLLALTKADKLSRSQRGKRLESLRAALGGSVAEDQVIVTSARTGEGCAELLDAVQSLTGSAMENQ